MRQEGCTYFVTFRLGDSLPAAAIDRLELLKNQWLLEHSIDPEDSQNLRDSYLKIGRPERAEFERKYARILNRYLDAGHGACVLDQKECALAFKECLFRFDRDRVYVGDYVIMENHVHCLLTPIPGNQLDDLLAGIKGASARAINRIVGSEGKLWMKDSFDHIVRDEDHLGKFQRYILENPRKAGIQLSSECLGQAEYGPAW